MGMGIATRIRICTQPHSEPPVPFTSCIRWRFGPGNASFEQQPGAIPGDFVYLE